MSKNTNKFDYEQIQGILTQMQDLAGDVGAADESTIAGNLAKIDKSYQDIVGTMECGEDACAIFGDVGSQLLLNWQNMSNTFPQFIDNFKAWSTYVAKAGEIYTQYETEAAKRFDQSDMGWAAPDGMVTSFVDMSVYDDAMDWEELVALGNQAKIHQLTNAKYVDTGMVAYEKVDKIWRTIDTIATVATLGLGSFSLIGKGATWLGAKTLPTVLSSGWNAAGTLGSVGGSKFLTTMFNTAYRVGSSPVGKAIKWVAGSRVISAVGTAFGWVAGNPIPILATGAVAFTGSNVASYIFHGDYDYATYGNGASLDVPLNAGEQTTINGTEYTFYGSTPAVGDKPGYNIYYGDDGKLVYQTDDGSMVDVLVGGSTCSYKNVNDNAVFYVGGNNVGTRSSLGSTQYIPEDESEDYFGYFDTISTLSDENNLGGQLVDGSIADADTQDDALAEGDSELPEQIVYEEEVV